MLLLGLVQTVENDSLIRVFGKHQLLRKGDQLSWSEKNQIRGKLRFLARLLHQIRSQTQTSCDLSTYLKPQYYDSMVEAVLEIRKSNKQLALTLGHYIKQVCLLNIGEAIKNGDKVKKSNSEEFLQLFNGSWAATVASSTIRMQQKSRLNKAPNLPTTKDLVTLTTYVKEKLDKQLKSDKTDYVSLQKLVMTALILYNKRRPAEVADIKVGDFHLSLHNQEDRVEILDSLTPEEKVVAER